MSLGKAGWAPKTSGLPVHSGQDILRLSGSLTGLFLFYPTAHDGLTCWSGW